MEKNTCKREINDITHNKTRQTADNILSMAIEDQTSARRCRKRGEGTYKPITFVV